MLIAREVPSYGGDTLFANQYLAHDQLSAEMRRVLGGLRAVHNSATAAAPKTSADRIRDHGHIDVSQASVTEQPAVSTQPATGRQTPPHSPGPNLWLPGAATASSYRHPQLHLPQ